VHSSIPALEAEAVTPSDTVNFSKLARAIYIGGAGNAVVVMENNDAITFNGLLAGTILPVRCKRVNAGATATNIVALF
jgi:hypothetical protein